jgi:ferrous iron transport protein A
MSAAVPDRLSGDAAYGRRGLNASGTLLAASYHVPVTIRDIAGDPVLCHRLLELGFTPGQPVTVMAAAPLGGPLAITLRGTIMAIRREEAVCILL